MEMMAYWKDNPPLHTMVAAYFGVRKKKAKPQPMSQSAIEEWMRAYPQTAPAK